MKNIRNSLTGLLVVLFAFNGCGTDSPDGDIPAPVLATGQFKDSNTQGLTYVSGSQTGVTDAKGTFTYEVGKSVTFSIGGVTVGSATGKEIITPIHLIPNSDANTTEVKNIVRFLMMLDADQNASNGITISTQVQAAAAEWNSVDFTTVDLDTELTAIVSSASTADSVTHTLPTALDAVEHMEGTLRCSFAGIYKGTYSGDSYGYFTSLVDARTGQLTGLEHNIPSDANSTIYGNAPIFKEITQYTIGSVAAGVTGEGTITSAGVLSGTWTQYATGGTGTVTGNRVGSSNSAVYRITGHFSGVATNGFYALDIDASNNITGLVYVLNTNETEPVTGGVVNADGSFAMTVGSAASATGTIDLATGTLSGTWTDPGYDSGSFTGGACKLN